MKKARLVAVEYQVYCPECKQMHEDRSLDAIGNVRWSVRSLRQERTETCRNKRCGARFIIAATMPLGLDWRRVNECKQNFDRTPRAEVQKGPRFKSLHYRR
jgi:hypothetical protein